MAIKVANKTENAKLWNFRMFFPTDNYVIRCLNQSAEVSQNNNPMTVLEWEIVNAEPRMIGESLVDFDGVKFRSWHVTAVKSGEDQEKRSQDVFNTFDEILCKAGHDTTEGWDDENPPQILKGKVFYAALAGKEQPMCKSPTPEQVAKGQKYGDVMKDPITGKDVVTWNINLSTLFALFEGEVKRPF